MKPLPQELKDKGFSLVQQQVNSNTNITSTSSSSTSIPLTGFTKTPTVNVGSMTAAEYFQDKFKLIVSQIVTDSNKYCQTAGTVRSKYDKNGTVIGTVPFEVTDKMIWNLIAIKLARGLLPISNSKLLWSDNEQDMQVGLFTSQFFKSTCSYRTYHKINRLMHVDLEVLVELVNTLNSSMWKPGKYLSVDDDMWLWTGRGGAKRKNDKKSAKTGIISWKVMDSSQFCIAIVFEDSELIKKLKESMNVKLSMALIIALNQLVPEGRYVWVVDAGLLGAIELVDYLVQHNREVIASLAANKPNAALKNYLHKFVSAFQYASIYHKNYTLTCFNFGKKSGGKGNKYFNVLYTLPELHAPLEIKRWDKKEQKYKNLQSLQVISTYNHCHGYIDHAKQRMVTVKDPSKNRRPFMAKFCDILYTQVNNIYILYCDENKIDRKKYTLFQFIYDVVPYIRYPRRYISSPSTLVSSSNLPTASSILLPALVKGTVKRCCIVCSGSKIVSRTYYYCSNKCRNIHTTDVPLCNNGNCNIIFHNPQTVIINPTTK